MVGSLPMTITGVPYYAAHFFWRNGMKKDKKSKVRNFVAKHAHINKGGAHRDKTKYYRKNKHKKPDNSGFSLHAA